LEWARWFILEAEFVNLPLLWFIEADAFMLFDDGAIAGA
jgi:hypothetical protein